VVDKRIEGIRLLLNEWKEYRASAIKVVQQAEEVISGLEKALSAIKESPMSPQVLPFKSPALDESKSPIYRSKGIGDPLLEIVKVHGPTRITEAQKILEKDFGIKVTRQAVYLQFKRYAKKGLVVKTAVPMGKVSVIAYALPKS
jgi:hypothetical protein